MLPQTVYLTLAKYEADPRRTAQVHFVRPRRMKSCHVFRVLIHIDVVEDLMFYHYPRAELLAEGRVPWREFVWQYGCANGDLDEEVFQPQIGACGEARALRWHPTDDDESDREQKRSRARGLMHRVSNWIDGRDKSREHRSERDHGSGRYRGESSHGRTRKLEAQLTPPRHNSRYV